MGCSLPREHNPSWKGGKSMSSNGYIRVLLSGHPRSDSRGYVKEQVLIAEQALGNLLPRGAIVHHVNGCPSDNRNTNLVICDNQAYHMLLHRRMRAQKATGNALSVPCGYCHLWGLVGQGGMKTKPDGVTAYHQSCSTAYLRQWKERRRT